MLTALPCYCALRHCVTVSQAKARAKANKYGAVYVDGGWYLPEGVGDHDMALRKIAAAAGVQVAPSKEVLQPAIAATDSATTTADVAVEAAARNDGTDSAVAAGDDDDDGKSAKTTASVAVEAAASNNGIGSAVTAGDDDGDRTAREAPVTPQKQVGKRREMAQTPRKSTGRKKRQRRRR